MGANLTIRCRRRDKDNPAAPSSASPQEPKRPAANFCDEFFTQRQKTTLRKTWVLMQDDLSTKGVQIFLRIFHLSPEAKQLFPFRHVEGDSLLKHPQFRSHGLRFMKAIGVAIDNLDTLDMVLIPSLISLGKRHFRIPGFSVDQFEVFVDAMDYVWKKELGKTYSKQTREAWLKLFNLITSTIREGYMEGMKYSNGQRTSLRPSMTPSTAAAMGLSSRTPSLTPLSRTPSGKAAAPVVINGSGKGPVEFEDIPPIDGIELGPARDVTSA